MGCVQGKGYDFSPKRLERMKVNNGYVKGSRVEKQHMQKRQQQQTRDLDRVREQEGINGRINHVVEEEKRIIGINQKEKIKGRDGIGNGVAVRIGNDNSQRGTSGNGRKIGGDELVDGWPKWLVDNIRKEVLVGLVPKTADSYDKLAKVGQGTYSNVYKAKDRKTGKIVALKKVRFDTSEPESVKFMAREIIILKRLDHPNIIKLEGLATSRMQYSLYLVFDFMESDLTKLINRTEGRLTEPQVKRYMEQLLSGLLHCHERGILHRDIKGSNLLIDKNGVLKIADFGLANFYQTKTKRPLTSRVVTLWYRAPELLFGSTDYSVGIDLWSAGCLLAEMFVGRPIMPGRNEVEQLHKIFKLCGSPPEEYWKKVKPPTTFRPPQQKPSFGQAFPSLPHSAFPLLYTLLSVEPHFRGTAATALQNEFFTTSPLACGLSELPVIKVEEDGPPQSIDITRRKKSSKGKRVRKNREGNRKLLSNISEHSTEEKQGESSNKSQEIGTHSGASSSTSFSLSIKSSMNNQSPPPSPTPSFKFRNINQSAKTEAHPNALKNIKNYPILLASITEAAKHYEDNRLSLNRRSISNIDFRNHHDLMDHKISKLFGLEDTN
ncbi:probable serine/threonine-protein kinase At1g54610 [Lycium ferocissimum]|uniref:probable serine/threonine-protein kinase At1g54610 n=1 Tax=Lycium ferocissimum TaxID=112874 RepID=UPI002815F3D7|nr:probable serine/threonine-protein kinase At1g54610 [Lycium ferocissimum]